jgi:hypothetical protein
MEKPRRFVVLKTRSGCADAAGCADATGAVAITNPRATQETFNRFTNPLLLVERGQGIRARPVCTGISMDKGSRRCLISARGCPMLRYCRDEAYRQVTAVASGRLTVAEVKDLIDWQILQGLWEYRVLYDVREVMQTLNSTELAELVTYIAFVTRRLPPRGPVAVLAASPALADAATEYASLGAAADARLRVVVFHEEGAAMRWLESQTSI